jgi:hypothetical protein
LDAQPTDGDDANYKVIVVVFTDLSGDRAQGAFDDVLQQLAVPSYVEDRIDIQHELPTIPIACAVSVCEARGHQRTGSSSWTTSTGSACGRGALENPQSRLLLRNHAACRGGPTNPRVASLRKEPLRRRRSFGWGKPGPLSEERSSRGDASGACPEATASAMKFPGAYSHGMCEARGRRVRGHRAR